MFFASILIALLFVSAEGWVPYNQPYVFDVACNKEFNAATAADDKALKVTRGQEINSACDITVKGLVSSGLKELGVEVLLHKTVLCAKKTVKLTDAKSWSKALDSNWCHKISADLACGTTTLTAMITNADGKSLGKAYHGRVNILCNKNLDASLNVNYSSSFQLQSQAWLPGKSLTDLVWNIDVTVTGEKAFSENAAPVVAAFVTDRTEDESAVERAPILATDIILLYRHLPASSKWVKNGDGSLRYTLDWQTLQKYGLDYNIRDVRPICTSPLKINFIVDPLFLFESNRQSNNNVQSRKVLTNCGSDETAFKQRRKRKSCEIMPNLGDKNSAFVLSFSGESNGETLQQPKVTKVAIRGNMPIFKAISDAEQNIDLRKSMYAKAVSQRVAAASDAKKCLAELNAKISHRLRQNHAILDLAVGRLPEQSKMKLETRISTLVNQRERCELLSKATPMNKIDDVARSDRYDMNAIALQDFLDETDEWQCDAHAGNLPLQEACGYVFALKSGFDTWWKVNENNVIQVGKLNFRSAHFMWRPVAVCECQEECDKNDFRDYVDRYLKEAEDVPVWPAKPEKSNKTDKPGKGGNTVTTAAATDVPTSTDDGGSSAGEDIDASDLEDITEEDIFGEDDFELNLDELAFDPALFDEFEF